MKGIQNMKRVIAVLLSMMLLCALTACSEPAAQPSNATTDAVVDLEAKTVTVTGNADVALLKQAITDADYEVIG